MDAARRFIADVQTAMIATRWRVDLLEMAPPTHGVQHQQFSF